MAHNATNIATLNTAVANRVLQDEYKSRTEAIIGSETELTNKELKDKEMSLYQLRKAIDNTNIQIPANLNKNFTQCLSTVSSHTSNIEALRDRATKLENRYDEIDSNAGSINRLDQSVSSLANDITNIRRDISEIEGNYTTTDNFNAQIEALNTQIGTLNAQIETLNIQIKDLENRVSTLENPSSQE